jgi:hypothetical protein
VKLVYRARDAELVAERARYRHSQAKGTDRELFELVSSGLGAVARPAEHRFTGARRLC